MSLDCSGFRNHPGPPRIYSSKSLNPISAQVCWTQSIWKRGTSPPLRAHRRSSFLKASAMLSDSLGPILRGINDDAKTLPDAKTRCARGFKNSELTRFRNSWLCNPNAGRRLEGAILTHNTHAIPLAQIFRMNGMQTHLELHFLKHNKIELVTECWYLIVVSRYWLLRLACVFGCLNDASGNSQCFPVEFSRYVQHCIANGRKVGEAVEACNSVTPLLPAFSSRLLFLLSIFVLYILGLKEGYQNWALQAVSPIVEDVMANGIEEDL